MSTSVLISGIGLIGSLALMAILIFKKLSPIIIGPIAAIIVCLCSRLPLFDSLTRDYMGGVADYFKTYFFIFLLGSILGNLYQESGAATRIGMMIANGFGSRHVMLACMIPPAILSYGGINSFVIIFAVYPIALKLFEEADLPTYMLPGIVCGGMWTFAMTGPFTPQIPNIISMKYLHTPSYAGLVPGVIGAAVQVVLILAFMNWAGHRAKKRGEHFQWPEGVHRIPEDASLPSLTTSLIPLVMVLVLFNVKPLGLDIIVCLVIGILLSLLFFWKYLPRGTKLLSIFNDASRSAVIIILNTAMIVGFGSVARSTAFYAYATTVLEHSSANPYVVAAVGANVFAGILGSASGGLALMYETLADTFLKYAQQGYNIGYIHRLCSDGSGGLDSLPWNGSIVSVFNVCHTTHQLSYKYNFVTCLVVPVIATFGVALPFCIIFG
ncbi:MAG: GntP family permease [Anaerovoracaceae bacterium]